MGIKTVEELRELPEFTHIEYERVQLPDPRFKHAQGYVVFVPKAASIMAYKHEPDDLLCAKIDGALYAPVLTDQGWRRQRVE